MGDMCPWWWAALGASLVAVALASEYSEEFVVSLPKKDGGYIGLSTRGPSAIRVRFMLDKDQPPIESPMIGPDEPNTPFNRTDWDIWKGIKTSFGSAWVTHEGVLKLQAKNDKRLFISWPWEMTKGILKLRTQETKFYGRGASPDDAEQLTSYGSDPVVCNKGTYVPYYYSPDGYAALGIVGSAGVKPWGHYEASYKINRGIVTWNFTRPFELYLMPAATLHESTQRLFDLVGKPRVLPRYAFGFLASRWGWESRAYIEDTLSRFRQGQYPIDAVIMDFEWFTNESDYSYNKTGKSYYQDFGYNPVLWPSPKEQFSKYRKDFDIRVGLLRKARLGNTKLLELVKKRGWLLPSAEAGGSWPQNISQAYAQDRCLNFSDPELREWYSKKQAHYLDDGVEFWWNDEGETTFFTFHWWSLAQAATLHAKVPYKRFFSLNRAWNPGMARVGTAVWTGDIDPGWKDLRQQPGLMLNWGLSGAPYVGCDIGGFTGNSTPDLLNRWMQLGAFMPIMRTHSTITPWAMPHWPWLWGDKAAASIRNSLELRYRLVPYHYSLAHRLYQTGALWVRPMVMEFPDYPEVLDMTRQFMDGDILVAPVLNETSERDVYLPKGSWFALHASNITQSPEGCDDCQRIISYHKGNQHGSQNLIEGPAYITGKAAYTEVPAFVRPGTVLPLAPVVQHTDALPGGPLEVQVYAGADGAFDLIEDDGETVSYEAGGVRTMHLKWTEASSTLSWEIEGSALAPGLQGFRDLFVRFISGTENFISDMRPIGITGSIPIQLEVAAESKSEAKPKRELANVI